MPSTGAFAPAGPHTIWKKRLAKENTETVVYHGLRDEGLQSLAPKFFREVEYNQDCILYDARVARLAHESHKITTARFCFCKQLALTVYYSLKMPVTARPSAVT